MGSDKDRDGHGQSGGHSDGEKCIPLLQERIDRLLSGNARASEPPKGGKRRLFAIFSNEDAHRAAALTAICIKIADEHGGVEGLEKAVDYLFESLENSPLGMVENAAKGFLLTHSYAKKRLALRSLEQLQPDMVKPSPRVYTDQLIKS